MPEFLRWRRRACAAAVVALAAAAGPVRADAAPTAAAPEPPHRSALDAQLFYQLLVGEMQLRNGDAGTAYRAFLDAAKRTEDPLLFRRAMDVALQARAGNEALEATQAWREALPGAADPLRLELQILAVLNRQAEAAEPLAALIELTPPAERAALISALPRLFERAPDKRQTAEMLQSALAPYLAADATRTATVVAQGRSWLLADDPERALALAQQAAAADPAAPGPALLALELLARQPAAERVVADYLARPDAEPAMRLAYARALMSGQRYADAIVQLEQATRARPDAAAPYLTLGALHLELRQLTEADAALQRYVALAAPQAAATPADPPASAASAPEAVPEPEDAETETEIEIETTAEDDADIVNDQGLVQAWLMLSQVAEERKDYEAAEAWLARIDDPRRALEVQARRALILARQGQVDAAVALVRRVPEREPGDARAKLMTEAQLLRDVQQWSAAYDAFAAATERFPDDIDLLYEQAMVAEKLDRIGEMERLLRRVIEIKPDHGHAHNALGYSLADRGQRLDEARNLIRHALALMPGDPFITDSLGWVEYRLGNVDEAVRLLREAWSSRPDTEIGAHLGEVLWAAGQRDEARTVWRQAQARDGANAVLRETLARLQVGL